MRYETSRSPVMDELDIQGIYLNEMGQHTRLTPEEEVELAQTIEAGRAATTMLEDSEKLSAAQRHEMDEAQAAGMAARQRFIEANLRLVVSIVRRYKPLPGMSQLELIQEGNLGLTRAVDKFDWRKGFRFSTYAAWWIRQGVQRAQYIHMHGASSKPEITRLINGTQIGSLNEPISEDGDEEMIDLLADERDEAKLQHKIDGRESFLGAQALLESLLTEDEVTITYSHLGFFGEEQTIRKIAEEMSIRHEKVAQIYRKARAKLRHPSAREITHLLNGEADYEAEVWKDRAACSLSDGPKFFPARGSQAPEAAKAICETCPVRQECYDYAVSNSIVHGVWGGMTPRQRKQARNSQ